MTKEQRERLDIVKTRLETLQNAGVRAGGLIERAEQAGEGVDVEELIVSAEKELASILKRKRTGKT